MTTVCKFVTKYSYANSFPMLLYFITLNLWLSLLKLDRISWSMRVAQNLEVSSLDMESTSSWKATFKLPKFLA